MCRDQKEGWTLDSMKERDAEMKRKRECLEGDTGRKREREREREGEGGREREEIAFKGRDRMPRLFVNYFLYAGFLIFIPYLIISILYLYYTI